jgi:multidrug transporter EmrE-like cation transporter
VKNPSLVWIIVSVLCSSLAHFALKQGALRLNLSGGGPADILLRLSTNGWLLIGCALHVLALALWIVGLKSVPLSVAYPFIALGFVLVSLLSWLFLNETVGVATVLGMVLIASGVALIARA